MKYALAIRATQRSLKSGTGVARALGVIARRIPISLSSNVLRYRGLAPKAARHFSVHVLVWLVLGNLFATVQKLKLFYRASWFEMPAGCCSLSKCYGDQLMLFVGQELDQLRRTQLCRQLPQKAISIC